MQRHAAALSTMCRLSLSFSFFLSLSCTLSYLHRHFTQGPVLLETLCIGKFAFFSLYWALVHLYRALLSDTTAQYFLPGLFECIIRQCIIRRALKGVKAASELDLDTPLFVYKALLSVYRAVLRVCRAFLRDKTAQYLIEFISWRAVRELRQLLNSTSAHV